MRAALTMLEDLRRFFRGRAAQEARGESQANATVARRVKDDQERMEARLRALGVQVDVRRRGRP